MKKIYMFYLYGEKDEINDEHYPAINGSKIIKGNNFNHVLYAWTPNKNLRKKFKSQRDMTKFHEVVHEISKDELNEFSDEYSDKFLEERPITSKNIDEDHIFRCKTVFILSTRKELDIIVDDEYLICRNQLECLIESEIYIREDYFSDKYKKVLEFLKLDDIMSYSYPLEDTDLPFDIMKKDTLALYSHLYYNTYRKDW